MSQGIGNTADHHQSDHDIGKVVLMDLDDVSSSTY